MEYLKKEEVVEGLIIEADSEVIELLKCVGDEVTLIDEDFADPFKERDRNDDTEVLGQQRWLVEIRSKDGFIPPHRTHRYIKYYIETYKERESNLPRLGRTAVDDRRMQLTGTLDSEKEGIPKGGTDGIEWDDNFSGAY